MDYPLENLGPERFKQLCQVLISKEIPDAQCFPVAQPDGGRDAVTYIHDSGNARHFVVYQVKYVRQPHLVEDAHKWLLDIISKELPKVRELVPRGASKYVLVTNVSGTAHLDVGSIDKANQAITAELSVPAVCWWRDDINRRLDGTSSGCIPRFYQLQIFYEQL
jgi:hypothetical protein